MRFAPKIPATLRPDSIYSSIKNAYADDDLLDGRYAVKCLSKDIVGKRHDGDAT